MTGDTEKGRSINVIKMFFPMKLNLAIAQAATNQNSKFSGTTTRAIMIVNLMADKVSLSLNDAR